MNAQRRDYRPAPGAGVGASGPAGVRRHRQGRSSGGADVHGVAVVARGQGLMRARTRGRWRRCRCRTVQATANRRPGGGDAACRMRDMPCLPRGRAHPLHRAARPVGRDGFGQRHRLLRAVPSQARLPALSGTPGYRDRSCCDGALCTWAELHRDGAHAVDCRRHHSDLGMWCGRPWRRGQRAHDRSQCHRAGTQPLSSRACARPWRRARARPAGA